LEYCELSSLLNI